MKRSERTLVEEVHQGVDIRVHHKQLKNGFNPCHLYNYMS